MGVPAWPLGEPVADQLGLMRGGVVHHDVDVQVGWHVTLDLVQELAELRCPVTRHAPADHCPRLHVKRGEHGRSAVALVVVSAPLNLPWAQGKQWLGSVKGLDLRLFIHAQTSARSGGAR